MGVVSLGIAAGAAAAAVRPRPYPFAPLVHAEKQQTVKLLPAWASRISGAAIVVRSANEAMGLGFLLPSAGRAAVSHVNFNRRVAIAVYLTTPSAGYSVAVRRVSLARVGRIKQWCLSAVVATPPPSQPQTGYVWTATHVVTVSSGRPRVGPPTSTQNWVLRDQHGKVMSVSTSLVTTLGGKAHPTAIARGCPP